MTITMMTLLTLQILFGALDNILHHEITERLPSKPSARKELALHSAREAIYGCLFLIFAWTEPHGLFAAAVLLLLSVEIVITIADFLEEDRTRSLPPFERVLHTILAILYGGFLLSVLPWLFSLSLTPSSIISIDHGIFSWFLTLTSVGVFAFAMRNFAAVRMLGTHKALTYDHPPSGRTILVTGGTGFIGAELISRLRQRGDRVIAVSRDIRQARALLGPDVHHISALNELPNETRIDAVVNLAGAPIIGLPWTSARRRSIWSSRIDTTKSLVKWMSGLEHKPRVLVSGSAIGFYGDRGDAPLSESAGKGEGFAADLCAAWEDAANEARAQGIRVVCLRIGLVLDKDGGAMPMMALPARFALGAIFGNGRQWMSWITRSDLVRLIVSGIDSDRWHGAVNAVAPEPVRHHDFQKSIARALKRPLFLGVPAWLLKRAMGEMSSIFLFSQRVVPVEAQKQGFAFDVHWAADALDLLLKPEVARQKSAKQPLQNSAPIADTAPTTQSSSGALDDDHPSRRPPVPLCSQSTSGARGKAA